MNELSFIMLFYILIKELRITYKDYKFKKAYNKILENYYFSERYYDLNISHQLDELYCTDAEIQWSG